jgi:hypothetical protein
MKKIYIIESILQTEINYVHLLKKFNETSLDIFEIFTFNYQLIEKLLKVELGELREQYLQEDITLDVLKEEIRETLKAKADNDVQAEADV